MDEIAKRGSLGDIPPLARETARVFEKLAHASGVVGLSLDSQIPAHKDSCRALLGTLAQVRCPLTDTPEGRWLKERKWP
jgi:hypothetical protein